MRRFKIQYRQANLPLVVLALGSPGRFARRRYRGQNQPQHDADDGQNYQ
jgi:hypothetical protein